MTIKNNSLNRSIPRSFNFREIAFNDIEVSALLKRVSQNNNDFLSDQWTVGIKGKSQLNFRKITEILVKYPAWLTKQQYNPIVVIKLLLLYTIKEVSSVNTIKVRFRKLIKVYIFLAENNKNQISNRCLDEFFQFMLNKSLTKNEQLPIIDNYKQTSFSSFKAGLYVDDWIYALKVLKINDYFWSPSISNKKLLIRLKNYYNQNSQSNLTFHDWSLGNSLNTLTLDYGKYYIEHCIEFFQKNIVRAIAVEKTLMDAEIIAEQAGMKILAKKSLDEVKHFINKFLLGFSPEEIPKIKGRPKRLESVRKLQKVVLKTYAKYYFQFKVRDLLLHEDSLKDFAESIDYSLADAADVHFFQVVVKVLLDQELMDKSMRQKNISNIQDVWLKLKVMREIDIKELQFLLKEKIRIFSNTISIKLVDLNFIENSQLNWPQSNKFPLTYFKRAVGSAGLVYFVSLTGWRASEYGFGLNDIEVSINKDILDQKSYPFRYHVNWYIPKTHKEKKVKREITESAFQCLNMLSHLNSSYGSLPCLYKKTKLTKSYSVSSGLSSKRLSAMWQNFVYHYSPFEKIDKKLTIQSLSVDELTASDLGIERNLFEAYKRARSEVKRLLFQIYNPYKSLGKMINLYKSRSLPDKVLEVFDTYLSSSAKLRIASISNEKSLSSSFVRQCSNEIRGDSLYPTNHAFRHMWAEAVYRRFDGDAGWMIRSQFKHISQDMWLAYIRDKDNLREHDEVKRRVLSSLLYNYLENSSDTVYAGNMDKYLRRVFKETKVTTFSNLNDEVSNYIDEEILDIKTNPWGYCILKKRAKHRAKCSINNVPNRQNASVNLCLGCPNNLTQSGNIPGIVTAIGNDLAVLQEPALPKIFSERSYKTVKLALKNLIQLNADEKILVEVRESLEAYKK